MKTRIIPYGLILATLSAFAACAADDDSATSGQTATLGSDPALDAFQARPPHHVQPNVSSSPTGLSPARLRTVYNLPSSGGAGTIAIIDAFDDPQAAADLTTFSAAFGLPYAVFEKHQMANKVRADQGWALEISLDVQWAHAVAPSAKILLVEARSASGTDLLAAIDYARSRSDVVAVSMSWGGGEFSSEASSDARFTSAYGATFFASSGDNGVGASWPAVSPNVVGVGGTTLTWNTDGSLAAETAWGGSGGGASVYESMPIWQTGYGLSGGKRLTPDIAANADPASGYSVYDSYGYQGQRGWFTVGGTSGSCPVWAGIKSLGLSADDPKFYQDAAANASAFFRDITSGSNGSCATCSAAAGYDQVTGLGSPLTTAY